MILLLTGDNDYELTSRVARLGSQFKGTPERYDAADISSEQLADIFAGQTLFATSRMILLDNPSGNQTLWQNLPTWVERLSDETSVVLIEPKLDKRTSAYKWLKKNVDIEEFPAYDVRSTREITEWLQRYAKQSGVSLSGQHVSRLIGRAGANQWELAHAVDKLALASEVTEQWIDDVTQASPTENVFQLFEVVLGGRLNELSHMLATLKLSEEPYRLLGLLNSQAIQLATLVYGGGDTAKVVNDSNAASAYPYQKLAPFALRMSKQSARQMIELLADADLRLKSSDADPWLVLESTLTQMASLMNE